jgi:LPXTG-site transpeptidase (sortase) family protein
MTLTAKPQPGTRSVPGWAVREAARAAAAAERRKSVPPPSLARHILGTTALILAASLLGFAAWLAFGSRLAYDRAQHDLYANFRATLALATAPTGPTQPAPTGPTQSAAPAQLLTPGTPIAILSIPAIGLRSVVLEGTSGEVLSDGPGHLRDTEFPGQAGLSEILGRRAAYGGPFGRLSALAPGQTFTVTTGQGVARYEVLDVRRPGDIEPPLVPGQGRLVLVTADGPPFAPSGLLRVDASLLSAPFPAPPMVVSAADVSATEKALATDPLAWVPLVLWGQALVLTVGGLSWLAARWGRWQTWTVGVPVLTYIGICIAEEVTRLLPNLM